MPDQYTAEAAGKALTVAELRDLLRKLDVMEVPDTAVVSARVSFGGGVRALTVRQAPTRSK